MGDNSAVSEDARYWNQPIQLKHEGLRILNRAGAGAVSAGQGRVCLLAGGFSRVHAHLAIIPNFGDMPWIH